MHSNNYHGCIKTNEYSLDQWVHCKHNEEGQVPMDSLNRWWNKSRLCNIGITTLKVNQSFTPNTIEKGCKLNQQQWLIRMNANWGLTWDHVIILLINVERA
jgi:hypothetical protein